MNPLRRLRLTSPAKIFAIGFAAIFIGTIVTAFNHGAGQVPLDLLRGEDTVFVFTVSGFYLLNPLVLALVAGLYAFNARFCQKKLSQVLVSIHFWISLAFASFVIYLTLDRVDLPVPDWQEIMRPRLETQLWVFMIGRIVFGVAQALFLINLLWSCFFGRKIQTQRL